MASGGSSSTDALLAQLLMQMSGMVKNQDDVNKALINTINSKAKDTSGPTKGDKEAARLGKEAAKQDEEDRKNSLGAKAGKYGTGLVKTAGGGDPLAMLAGKLAAILAPAAVLANIISSDASGMSVFMSAIKVVGNTLGSTLAPAIMFGTAVLLTLNDMVADVLMNNLEGWANAVVDVGIGAIDLFADGVKFVTTLFYGISTTIKFLDAGFKRLEAGAASTAAVFLGLVGDAKGKAEAEASASSKMKEADKEETDAIKEAATNVGISGDMIKQMFNDFKKKIGGNLAATIDEFKRRNAPNSQSMSLAEASKSAQMAAFNMSPFEQKNLVMLQKIVDIMGGMANKIQHPTSE